MTEVAMLTERIIEGNDEANRTEGESNSTDLHHREELIIPQLAAIFSYKSDQLHHDNLWQLHAAQHTKRSPYPIKQNLQLQNSQQHNQVTANHTT
jgi:hypothetical protein